MVPSGHIDVKKDLLDDDNAFECDINMPESNRIDGTLL